MEFDPEYGLVERGTAGHRASAQVVDVAAEIAALRELAAQSYHDGYWWPEMPRAMRARRLEELNQHHVDQRDGLRDALRQLLRTAHHHSTRLAARGHVTHKLAILAPYIAILRAGDEKRATRPAQGAPHANH